MQIVKFRIHQNPHHTEKDSIYPEYSEVCQQSVKQPLNNDYAPADSLDTDSLIPDSSNTDSQIPDIAPAEFSNSSRNGTRLPENWVLSKEWKDWALENSSLSESQIQVECDKFRDHWYANANQRTGKKSDWFAAWRNWVRNSKPDKPQTKTTNARSSSEQVVKDFIGNQELNQIIKSVVGSKLISNTRKPISDEQMEKNRQHIAAMKEKLIPNKKMEIKP